MDEKIKKNLMVLLYLSIGCLLVFTDATATIHDFLAGGLAGLFGGINTEISNSISECLGYFGEIAIISVLMFTPFCGIAAPWLIRISYELMLGHNSGVNVFLIAPQLNFFMGGLCIILAIYCFFHQYSKAENKIFKEKIKVKDELSRFL